MSAWEEEKQTITLVIFSYRLFLVFILVRLAKVKKYFKNTIPFYQQQTCNCKKYSTFIHQNKTL